MRRKRHACDAKTGGTVTLTQPHHRRTPPFLRGTPQVHPAVAQTLAHLDALFAHPLAPQLLLGLAPPSTTPPIKTDSSAPGPASHPSPVAALVDRALTELEAGLDAKARTCKCKVRRILFGGGSVGAHALPFVFFPPPPTRSVPPSGPGRRVRPQQCHVRHGDGRVQPSPRPARGDVARVARRRGELRKTERVVDLLFFPQHTVALAHLSPSHLQIDTRVRDLRTVLWAPTVDAVTAARVSGALSKDAAKAVAAGVAALDDARAAYAVVDPALRARVRGAVEAELVVPYEVREMREKGGGGQQPSRLSLPDQPPHPPPSLPSPSAPTATPPPEPCATRPPRCARCWPTFSSCATTATRPRVPRARRPRF